MIAIRVNQVLTWRLVLGLTLAGPVLADAQVLELSDVLKHVRANHPQIQQQRASLAAKQFGANAVAAQRLLIFFG